ncbi:MAG: M23 family metallopeptidase, partial [Bacteroidales bacterium]|nr:M23 family metallopeptidase [Bacteroidales bacterium]
QQFSPEKNLYSQTNYKERFRDSKYISISLPFWGEWKVTQGQDDEITHKDDWKHAWDFEITDEENSAFKRSGTKREDYYCYNKPIIAPADGWVEEIVDGIDDNKIGDVNMENNWGNTIVIKHAEKLYSKVSHIKKESFKVKKGEFIKKGKIIAYCGNSGRSPQPHIHFQIQSEPYFDSKTLDYPIGNYILNENSKFELKSFDKPQKNDIVSNIEKNDSLYKAFHFIPGQKLKFSVSCSDSQKDKIINWKIEADIYNNLYILCENSKSRAYFKNDGNIFYFTHFEGNKKSLLFYFYMGVYKIVTGFYKGLIVNDRYPLNTVNNNLITIIQDFIAPFYMFIKADYTLEYIKMDDNFSESSVFLKSKIEIKICKKLTKEQSFEIYIKDKSIEKFVIFDRNKKIEAKI